MKIENALFQSGWIKALKMEYLSLTASHFSIQI